MTQQAPTTSTVPPWLQALTPEPDPSPPLKPPSQLELALLRKQDMLDTFEKIFDPAMEALADGTSIVKFLQSDHRSLSAGRFMRWIMDDPQRYRAYLRSHEVAMELISNDLIPIADGKDDPMEDVARSKLRVDARKLMMGFNAKDRFTTTTKVDVAANISITTALQTARSRLETLTDLTAEDVIDVSQPLLGELPPGEAPSDEDEE